MLLEEFLIKIGVDASKAGEIAKVVNQLQTGANQLSNATNKIQSDVNRAIKETNKSTKEAGNAANKTKSKLFSLRLILVSLAAAAVLYGKKLVRAFNSAIDKAKELATKKDTLFKISKKELQQANQYKREMDKTGLAIDSIKTKIALNLAPALTNLIGGFRNWLTINKELVANGITKIIKAVGMAIQVVVNFVKFLNMVITNTIGWKNAIIAFGIAWAILNRGFLFSPLGKIIILMTSLMLLIDDLMVYMNGGNSLFGEYWQPFIDGAKAAWEFIKDFWELLKALWNGDSEKVKSLSNRLFNSLLNGIKSLFSKIKSLLANLFKNILMFFGMSEKDAKKTVNRIGKIFGFIFDAITFPFRMAYKAICAIMDWLGIDAGDVVNGIGSIFKGIWDFVTWPFRAAWKFVNDLFDIWEDDTTSVTDKIGKTLWSIWDFVTWPFRAAWNYVKNLFTGWIDDSTSTTSKIGKVFSDIWDYITSPFKTAWNFVKNLFTGWIDDAEDTTKNFGKKFLEIHKAITKPFEDAIKWIKDKFLGFIDTVGAKVKGALSWTGLFDDDDKTVLVKRENQIKINPALSASAGVTNPNNSNKNINNNNAVTINNTMNVTTPQEGLANLNALASGEIQKIADNSTTALGSN